MSSDSDPLRHLLTSYEAEGESAGSGAFTLEPGRARELLREQGRLGQNSFLYLLAAIAEHADEPISVTKRSSTWRLEWSASYGPLPSTLAATVAEASFQTHGVTWTREPHAITLRSRKLEELYQDVAPRLCYYPFAGRAEQTERDALYRSEQLVLLPARERWPRFLQVVRGITYATRWGLPVDAVCFDDQARPDLGLNIIPDSARKDSLMESAELQLLRTLRQSVVDAPCCLLHPDKDSSDLPLFATYLHYIVTQDRDLELSELSASRVLFPDATGREWSAAELLKVYARDGRLMIVDAVSSHGPSGDRPVLIWSGQVERIGSALFSNLTSGAGYLYSLAVNELEKQRLAPLGEPRLSSLKVEGGALSLLPWGDPDRIAELEFLGPRRARETFYLEPEAPRGLRLVWESEQSREEELRQLVLERPLRHAVLQLIDLSPGEIPRETLKTALSWGLSTGPLDWTKLPRLERIPLFECAGGAACSVSDLRELEGPVSVLPDLSCSLPRSLPLQPLLWGDPLLERLGIATQDASRQVREAYWQEVGRERWLAAHAPTPPDWPSSAREVGPHRLSRAANRQALTEVAFWREGRPFGRRSLPADQCPPGFLVMWVEDDLPGDTYWSGPSPEALARRLPRIAALCRDAERDGGS